MDYKPILQIFTHANYVYLHSLFSTTWINLCIKWYTEKSTVSKGRENKLNWERLHCHVKDSDNSSKLLY